MSEPIYSGIMSNQIRYALDIHEMNARAEPPESAEPLDRRLIAWARKWCSTIPKRDGMVYMLSLTADKHYVKAGRTKNLERRLNVMRGGSPFALETLFEWPVVNMEQAERDLHTVLAPAWVAGEWFAIPRGELKTAPETIQAAAEELWVRSQQGVFAERRRT